MTLEQISKTNKEQMKLMSTDGKVESSFIDAPGARFARLSAKVKTTVPKGLSATLYLALKGRTLVAITFTADGDNKAFVDPIADQSIRTFKFQ